MTLALILLVVGILLSAFFSGSETGFYRVSRVRLVLDARSGSRVARRLLWLSNNPSWFVATTLVGNNLANYLTTLAIVILVARFMAVESYAAEITASLLFAPLLFVYGELLPKNLYFHAPNLLLRRGGGLFLLFMVLFSPVACLLWVLGRVLQWLVGEAPEHARLSLARKELQQVFQQGQEAGVLHPAQQSLAQNLFSVASHPVLRDCTPVARVVSIRKGVSKSEALRLARRQRLFAIPVSAANGRELIGYVRVVDLYLDPADHVTEVRPLLEIHQSETFSATLMQLQSKQEPLARVVDDDRKTVGILNASRLVEMLFRAG